jgi:uncharacterized phiE125 gp8 family phage protein
VVKPPHHKPDGHFSTLVNGPDTALISTDDAKVHLRVDHDEEDAYIAGLVQAATDHLDAEHGILGRALITQRWQLTMQAFPAGALYLPVGRVQQVTSVAYYDTDNAEQALATDQYRLIINDESAIMELVAGVSWPSTYARSDAVKVQYDTGYGDTPADVPQAIRSAALLLVGHWYENRDAVIVGTISSELPLAVQTLLSNYRVTRGFI